MLIKRKIIQTDPVPQGDTNITVVKPSTQPGLLAGMGVITILAIGVIGYLAWYLPNQAVVAPTSVVVTQPVDSGRAQHIIDKTPAPSPSTVIVNPPPIIQQAPAVVTPRDTTTYVIPGSSSPAPAPHTTTTTTTKINPNGDTTSTSTTDTNPNGAANPGSTGDGN